MALIKSISGIRGTIGGIPGEALTPLDIVRFTSAYATLVARDLKPSQRALVVVGRDARVSGSMVSSIVIATLNSMGFDVVDIDLATTPTTEIAVTAHGAAGGIIITASHNPGNWNALKLLDSNGEFFNDAKGKELLAIAAADSFNFATVQKLGKIYRDDTCLQKHIDMVLSLPLVDREAIASAKFKVAVDAVNSVGGVAIPTLLRELGVEDIVELNCDVTGNFAHNPEPIPENLKDISRTVVKEGADVGIVVDPDVDRLAIVCEDGEMFIEENTLIAIADYVLRSTPGSTVSNLSSSRGLRDVTLRHGCSYTASAVGEVNVVAEMKRTGAIIGGEGNGGVIYPAAHYGRDALVGVALFLSLLAKDGRRVSEIKASLPQYHITKNKKELTPDINVDVILDEVKAAYSNEKITDIDGVKIDFADGWVHLRKSNTEPIIRIYAEAETMGKAEALAANVMAMIDDLVSK